MSEDTASYQERIQCHQHLLKALTAEMDRRPSPDQPSWHDQSWIANERLALTVAANEWAQSHGRRCLTVQDVERIEGLAVGHVDYASKLALYVMEAICD